MSKTLEEKQAEKARLAKAYVAKKRAEWNALVEREPRLLPLRKAINRADDPRKMLIDLSNSWVRLAPPDIRYAALRMIDKRANKMARQQGGEALDDPLPPYRNVYIAAREMLDLR